MEKEIYRIKEVALLLGVTQATIRFWESNIPQLNPSRDKNKIRRFYRPNDISLMKGIKNLLDHGIAYRGVRLILNDYGIDHVRYLGETNTSPYRSPEQVSMSRVLNSTEDSVA